MPENHENLPWEVRVIDVFQLTGREGVTVTAAWLSKGWPDFTTTLLSG
jgi:hypothetical protein